MTKILLDGKEVAKQREQFLEHRIAGMKDEIRNNQIQIEHYQEELDKLKKLNELYYLKVTDSPFDYLSLDLTDGTWAVSIKEEVNGYQTQFSKEEIMDINEKLWAIAVPVEEEDRQC